MKNESLKLVIVGGVAAGASAAARARRLSENADITVIERGPDVSFANCGLPYYIGGEIRDRAKLSVHTPESLASTLGIKIRANTEALAIDREHKRLKIRSLPGGEIEELAYDKLILAPGASPLRPPLPGIDNPRILTLRSLGDMDRIKDRLQSVNSVVVIGAGFIGLEMAEQLSHAGKKVSIVEMADQVLPQMDKDIASMMEDELKLRGVELVLSDGIASFETDMENGPLTSVLSSGKKIRSDMVILSIGVRPESKLAEEAGLELGARKTIKVNEWMQTSDPDIYAAGDVVESVDRLFGKPMNLALGGPANRQGRIVATHIFEKEKAQPYPGHIGTAIVRVFDIAAGMTGWTEKRLIQENIPHEVSVLTDYDHASYYPGATHITLKLLWSPKNGRVLGAQAVGVNGVDKRLDVIATAIAGKLGIDELAQLELAYAPPFGSARDIVNTAGFVAQNHRNGFTSSVRAFPSERKKLDVRPKEVFKLSPVEDAVNIPLPELRSRIGELDKNTSWAAVCSLGKTSYFAARILAQNGMDVVSVAGGLKFQTGDSHESENIEANNPPSKNIQESTSSFTLLDCTGLSCPGPLMRLKDHTEKLASGEGLTVTASDPGFLRDVQAFSRSTGLTLLDVKSDKGIITARIMKPETTSTASPSVQNPADTQNRRKGATLVVFSGEMDKVMATLVIANGAASMGGKVTLFFTFWGINALRKEQKVPVANRGFLDRMFSWMLPRGLKKLPLSKMNFMGLGSRMMKHQMSSKNLPNLPGLLGAARMAGVRMVACTMSMEAMGIRKEELIDDVELGGVADYLDSAEQSGTNLFV